MTPNDKSNPRYESGVFTCPKCNQDSVRPIVPNIWYDCPNEHCEGQRLMLKRKYTKINKEE